MTSKVDTCNYWHSQSGYNCYIRFLLKKPKHHLGICSICEPLINDILLEPNSTTFRDDLVYARNRRIAEIQSGDDQEPRELTLARDAARVAQMNAEAYAKKSCHIEYDAIFDQKQKHLDAMVKKHEEAKTEGRNQRHQNLRADYHCGCYGDSETIRELLFLLSSICLEPSRLRFISLFVNSYNGDISYSITYVDPTDNQVKRQHFQSVFENVFRNAAEEDAYNVFFSARGMFPAFELFFIGGIKVFPSISDTTTSRFERSVRWEQKVQFGFRLSLQACARMELLRAKRNSLLQEAIRFTHGMNAIQFGESNFFASLSLAASHLKVSITNKEYGQETTKVKKRVFVETPKALEARTAYHMEPIIPEDDEEDHRNAPTRSRSQSPTTGESQDPLFGSLSPDQWEEQRMNEINAELEQRAHRRKQAGEDQRSQTTQSHPPTSSQESAPFLNCHTSEEWVKSRMAEIEATKDQKAHRRSQRRKQVHVLRRHVENYFRSVKNKIN